MQTLEIDAKPRLRNVMITSMKGVSGASPGQGAHMRMAGERKAMLFRGKGLEFEKYRVFSPDDDAQMIDWKASLRAHKILVKMYSEEQNKDILFCVDVSSSMSYGSTKKLKNEYAAELVCSLAFSAIDNGDNVGLVLFTDHLVKVIPPMSGIGQWHKIVAVLKTPSLYEGKFDLTKSLYQLMGVLKRQAIIFFASDFIGLSGDWKRALELMSAKYELIGLMIRDPLDDDMPPAKHSVVLSDPFSEQELLVDPINVWKKYNDINEEQIREIRNLFRKIQTDLLILHTDEDFVKPVQHFLMGS